MKISKNKDHLLLTLSIEILTLEIAIDAIKLIAEKSSEYNCTKVLLDERSVKKRDVTPDEIMRTSKISTEDGLDIVHTAILCNPELIDKNAERFSLFSYTNEYKLQFFSDKTAALKWLSSIDTSPSSIG